MFDVSGRHFTMLAVAVDAPFESVPVVEEVGSITDVHGRAAVTSRGSPARSTAPVRLVQPARLELASARLAVTFATSRKLGVPSLR